MLSTLESGIDLPPATFFFQKCTPRHSYCTTPPSLPPVLINFLPKTRTESDQNTGVSRLILK